MCRVGQPELGLRGFRDRRCCAASKAPQIRNLYVTELGSVSSMVRYRLADGARERLADGAAAQETVDDERVLYTRQDAPGLYARSVREATEERLVDDSMYPPSAGV